MKYYIREHLLNYKKTGYVNENELICTKSKDLLDCSLGINPYGHSRLLDDSVNLFDLGCISRYPEYPYLELIKEIKKYWGDIAEIEESNIRVGHGSMGILERINKMFIDKGTKVLGYCPQFTDYMLDVERCGGIYDYIRLNEQDNYKFNLQDMLSAIKNDCRLIYIDNPNNPTGQIISLSSIECIVREAEKNDVCVIVDEAYGDFMEEKNSAIGLTNKYENLFVVRSVSKGFGLAGLRIGYLVTSPKLADYYSRVDVPFQVNSIGEFLAKIALKDRNFIITSRDKIKDAKQKIINSCTKVKILETSMEVPIMTLQYPDSRVDLYEELLKRGIITESCKSFIGLGKNSVRLKIPENWEKIIDIINDLK